MDRDTFESDQMRSAWHRWQETVDVRDFIQSNYTQGWGFFTGGERSHAAVVGSSGGPDASGTAARGVGGGYGLATYPPGYIDIDRELEQVVGLQTDQPLKRAILPFGGIRTVKSALEAHGYQLDPQTEEIFTKYRKTHNDGVFDGYTTEMRNCRRSGIITGLPDDRANIEAIADLAAPMTNIERVEVLPFHKMGEYKWEQLGWNYALKNTPEPHPELVEATKNVFRSRGLFTT